MPRSRLAFPRDQLHEVRAKVHPRVARARQYAVGARLRLARVLVILWRSVLVLCSLAMIVAAVLHARGNQPASAQVVTLAFALAVAMVPVGLFTEFLLPKEDKP